MLSYALSPSAPKPSMAPCVPEENVQRNDGAFKSPLHLPQLSLLTHPVRHTFWPLVRAVPAAGLPSPASQACHVCPQDSASFQQGTAQTSQGSVGTRCGSKPPMGHPLSSAKEAGEQAPPGVQLSTGKSKGPGQRNHPEEAPEQSLC